VQPQATGIAGVSRDDVQMSMRYDLARRLALGEKVADPLRSPRSLVESRSDRPAELEHPPGFNRIDPAKILLMVIWNYQHMTRNDREQVHERRNNLASVHEARLALTPEYLAEYAIGLEAHPERVVRYLLPG
jgi:hypothetical protein